MTPFPTCAGSLAGGTRLKPALAAALLLCGAPGFAQTLAPGVRLVTVSPAYQQLNTASFSRHALVSVGSTQYITFYGVNTNVTVGRRTLGATNWTLSATAFKPNNATDGHDVISIGVSSDGYLHCSWGMHGDAFHYARSPQPWSLTLVATNMTGAENRVTYPQFPHCPNGDILYLFREGGSGNGDTYLNRWSSGTHTWTNVHQTAGVQAPFIFASGAGAATNANAYPNFAMFDSQTNLHLTWCWREDASTIEVNHDQNYARSPDYGRTWTKWNGTPYTLPITKATAEIIWPIPINSTLMNQVAMTIDTNDRPVVCTWWAPRGAGTPIQIMLLWNDGTQWRTNQIGQRTTTQWIGRPIIVCDKSNNLFIVFRDPERGNKPTLGWCFATNRAGWNFADLTSESLGGWEPDHDPDLWSRSNKLHLFYQYVGGATLVTAKVLEFDPAVFLANLPTAPLSYVWTAGSGNWSVASNWSGGVAPPVGGADNLSLSFTGITAGGATNDLAGDFFLNQLLLASSAASTNLLTGNPLVFTNSSAGPPALVQSGAAAFVVANPLRLGAEVSVALNTAAPVALDGNLTDAGGLAVSGAGQLLLSASNSFSGALSLNSGTLAFGANSLGSGPLTTSGGKLRWLPGTALDLCAGRAVTLAGTTTFDPNGNRVTVSGGLGGAGALTLSASLGGALVLAGSNAYSGLTTISSGTLVAAHASALGGLANHTVVPGGTATSALGLQGGITLAEPVRCGGRQPLTNASALAAHVLNLSGTNTLTGSLTAETGGNQYNLESAAGSLIIAGNYSQVVGTGPRYLNLQGAGDASWTGAINDGTANIYLTKRGPGRWSLSGTNTFTGPTVVTEGTLLVNGVLGTNTVTVTNATLGGSGMIRGATTIQSGGVISPGSSIGQLSFSSSLTLNPGSTSFMEVDAVTLTNDSAAVTGALTYGGNLAVTNLGGVLAAGNRFRLFSASSYTGVFSGFNFPPLSPGLAWNSSELALNGSLWVVTTRPPVFTGAAIEGGNLVLRGTGGTPGWPYVVLCSTNLAPPLGQWTPLATNIFDAAGAFSLTYAANPHTPRQFYRLQVP